MRLPYPSLCAACLKVHWTAVPKTPLWHTNSKRTIKTHAAHVWRCTEAPESNLCVAHITSNCIRMPYPSLCIACLKVQWTAVSKALLCWEHSRYFPTSPLGQYCAGSLLLNFGGQKRSGVLIRKERSNLCAAHLEMQWSAGFKMCKMHQIAWDCRVRAYALRASKCIELLYQRPRSDILIRYAPSKLTRRTSEDALKRQSPTCFWHRLHQTVLECRIQAYALHASKCSELLYPKPCSAGSTLSTSQPVP